MMGTAASTAARRGELAAFLRARRASLKPQDVGLEVPPGRRNTPGLRREEVARISGVGLTWYTWLEQGRPKATSAQVIDALARGLRLDPEGHAHLRCLAGLPPPDVEGPTGEVTAGLHRLLDLLAPAPACAFDQRFDLIAWNDPFAKIWEPDRLPVGRRNVLWMAFGEAGSRKRWGNWEERGRTLLAEFRAAAGQHAGDARFEKLVKELEQQSSEFRCWWAGYEVRQSIAGPLKARAGDVGVINFEVIELRLCPDPSLRVVVHAPEREADERRLNRLLSRPSTGHSVGWARTG